MKSWTFLKESMDKIGDQVKEILSVRNDISTIQEDLKTQQQVWQQAELQLNQENAKLVAELEGVRNEVSKGASVRDEVLKLQQSVDDTKRLNQSLWSEFGQEQKRYDIEKSFLVQRKANLTSQLEEVNRTANEEVRQAEDQTLQLQTDQVALRLKVGELQDKLQSGQKELLSLQQLALQEKKDLERQLAEMHEGLVRVQEQLVPPEPLLHEKAMLEAQLQQETAGLIKLQEAFNQVDLDHKAKMQARQMVLGSEKGKAETRRTEAVQFCQPVHAQNEVLQRSLEECQSGSVAGSPAGAIPQLSTSFAGGGQPVVVPGMPAYSGQPGLPPASISPGAEAVSAM